MDSQPNQPQPSNQMPKSTAWVMIVVIILFLGVGGYFLLKQGNSNTNNGNTTVNTVANINTVKNTNTASNANATTTINGPTTYNNSAIPFTLEIPASAIIYEQHVSSVMVNGTTYPSFSITVTDSRVSGEMTISNRATGFENEQTTSETQGQIDGKPVRIIESTRTTTNSTSDKIARYLFLPLNNGTMYEEMWISYPINTQTQGQVFQSIVNNIKFK